MEDQQQANRISAHQARMGPGQSFLESLNAKLAQQHIVNAQNPQLKANRIRQIINSKAQVCSKWNTTMLVLFKLRKQVKIIYRTYTLHVRFENVIKLF